MRSVEVSPPFGCSHGIVAFLLATFWNSIEMCASDKECKNLEWSSSLGLQFGLIEANLIDLFPDS